MHKSKLKYLPSLIAVCLTVAIGSIFLRSSLAATPFLSTEPEDGVVQSPGVVVSDASASGAKAIKFSAPAVPPPASSDPCATFPSLPAVKPVATNTGVPAGTTLTNATSITATTAGMVINAVNVTGGITVSANNVTIKNSKVTTGGYYGINVSDGVTGTKILNSEIYTTGGGYIGVQASDTIICGSYLHGWENAITAGGGMTVQANYIDKLASNQAAPHYDGIEVYYGGNSKYWGNNIRLTSVSGAWLVDTGAINITAFTTPIDNVELSGNWLGGGSYSLYVDEQSGFQATNIKVTNNRWYRGSYLYGPANIRDQTSVTTWSGNVYDDNGEALPR